ncbi:MAG: hypothetical protein K8T25_19860 [Planctomycetia bacterium]|nr:hypothetical protein [Planctomycetia bacterium]
MNDPLKQFAALAAEASGAPGPPLDVSARVIADLRCVRPEPRVDWPLVTVSGLALAASLLVAVWGFDLWSTLTDPFGGLLEPLAMVIQ